MVRYIDADKLCKGLKEMASFQYPDKQSTILGVVSTIENTPSADVVHIDEVFRLIAGHSNYHGDDILAALKCVTEGKEVNPVKPLSADVVEVVRCKDCKFVKLMSDGKTLACRKQTAYRKPTDFCSYGGRNDKE